MPGFHSAGHISYWYCLQVENCHCKLELKLTTYSQLGICWMEEILSIWHCTLILFTGKKRCLISRFYSMCLLAVQFHSLHILLTYSGYSWRIILILNVTLSVNLLWRYTMCKESTWLYTSSGWFEALNRTVNSRGVGKGSVFSLGHFGVVRHLVCLVRYLVSSRKPFGTTCFEQSNHTPRCS